MDKLDQFLAYLKHERHALPNSLISYKSDLSMMPVYCKERNIELENVDYKVIRDFLLTLHKRKLKKTSIYKKVSCIKSLFRFCKERSWIRKEPAKIIECPKFEKPVPSFFTEQEMEKFLPLPILELRDYAIRELLYATGIGGNELVGIDIENTCLTEKYLRIDIKHLKALHKKYHPKALEQPEKEIQALEDIAYPYSYCDLVRY